MKKIILLISLTATFLIQSCNESFDPYTSFTDKYGLVCILKSDTTLQFAMLTKNYISDEFNLTKPRFNFEENADVRLWSGDSAYKLKDTLFVTSQLDTIKGYYTKKILIQSNTTIEIEALLSSGKRLKAVSQTPPEISFDKNSEVIIPPVGKNIVQVNWNSIGTDYLYQSRLRIKCEVTENGTNKVFYKDLPDSYSTSNGVISFFYPKPERIASVIYNLDAIKLFLQEFSDSLNNPSAISIHQKLILDIVTYDKELSKYISVSSSTLDDLSIRFDEGEYTNVSGGLGIFGSQLNKKYEKLKFLESFIRSYNFNFIYDN